MKPDTCPGCGKPRSRYNPEESCRACTAAAEASRAAALSALGRSRAAHQRMLGDLVMSQLLSNYPVSGP